MFFKDENDEKLPPLEYRSIDFQYETIPNLEKF